MYDHYTVIIINILIIIIIIVVVVVTVVVVSRAYDFLRKKWIFFAADFYIFRQNCSLNPLIRILKSQSNGPLYSSPLLAVPNVTAHPSTANVPSSYYLMWHYNCL